MKIVPFTDGLAAQMIANTISTTNHSNHSAFPGIGIRAPCHIIPVLPYPGGGVDGGGGMCWVGPSIRSLLPQAARAWRGRFRPCMYPYSSGPLSVGVTCSADPAPLLRGAPPRGR